MRNCGNRELVLFANFFQTVLNRVDTAESAPGSAIYVAPPASGIVRSLAIAAPQLNVMVAIGLAQSVESLFQGGDGLG